MRRSATQLFHTSFHFDQGGGGGGGNLNPDKNHRVKVSPKTLLEFVPEHKLTVFKRIEQNELLQRTCCSLKI